MSGEGVGLVDVLRAHLAKDRYDDEGGSVGTYCTCGGWTGDYFADGEAGPFDDHLAQVVADWLRERAADEAVQSEVSSRLVFDGVMAPRTSAMVVAIPTMHAFLTAVLGEDTGSRGAVGHRSGHLTASEPECDHSFQDSRDRPTCWGRA